MRAKNGLKLKSVRLCLVGDVYFDDDKLEGICIIDFLCEIAAM